MFYAAVGIMRNINGNPSERTFCQHLTSMSLYAPNPGHHPEWMNQQEFRTGRQYKTSTEAEEEKWLLALQSHHFHFIIWWQDGVEKLNSNQSGRKFHFSYSDSPAPEFLAFRYMYCPQIYISVFTSAGLHLFVTNSCELQRIPSESFSIFYYIAQSEPPHSNDTGCWLLLSRNPIKARECNYLLPNQFCNGLSKICNPVIIIIIPATIKCRILSTPYPINANFNIFPNMSLLHSNATGSLQNCWNWKAFTINADQDQVAKDMQWQ